MDTNKELIIANNDFVKISSLILGASEEVQEFLQGELDRAVVVPDGELPGDVVSMNSAVTFLDLDTKKENQVTLVYPHESNIEENKISVLAPIGAALIGLRVGQTIRWPLPGGRQKQLKVMNVVREREAADQEAT